MSFKKWYYNEDDAVDLKPIGNAESHFEKVVGVRIPSLKSFISWLILRRKITGTVKLKGKNKPVSLLSLPDEKKIIHLVKKLKDIDDLAKEFNNSFGALDRS